MLVTVDKEDFVVAIQSEYATTPLLVESMPAMTQQLQRCSGPWHNHNGKYENRPIEEFSVNARTGLRYKTCDLCRNNHQASYRRITEKNGVTQTPEPQVPGSDFRHGVDEMIDAELKRQNSDMPLWRITIIKRTIVEVRASDFLDAASQAGDGEVLKVERVESQ
jgi:hypothetical protein